MHPFFSGASRSPSFLRVIDSALDSADSLVAVSTHPDNLWRGYVQYEWETFLQDILEKRKPEATMLSMVSGFEPADLPRPFRREECIKFDRERLELSLERLVEFLPPYGGGSS